MKLRRLRWILYSLITILVLLSIPEIVVYFKLDKKNLRSRIDKFISDSKISINYDGYGFGAYNGLVLYEVNIAGEADFNRGRSFIVAKEVRLSFDWLHYIKNNEIQFRKLTIDNPQMELWYENEKLSSFLIEQLTHWNNSENSVAVRIKDARLKLNAQLTQNRKKIYNIENVYLDYLPQNKNSINVQYKDKEFGKGKISTQLIPCDAKINYCGNFLGKIDFSFNRFPAQEVGFWISKWSFNKGYLEGKLQFDSIIREDQKKKILSRKLQVDSEFDEIELAYKGQPFFKDDDIILSLSHEFEAVNGADLENELTNNVQAKAETKHHKVDLFVKKSFDIWPEQLSLTVLPKKSHEKTLILPLGISIEGLKKLTVSFTKPEKIFYAPIRNFKAEVYVEDGKINFPQFEMDSLNLKLVTTKENNFDLNFTAKTFQALIDFQDSFSVNSLSYPYAEILFSSFHGGSRVKVHEMVALPSKHQGKITVKNFDHEAFAHYYQLSKQFFDEKVVAALKELWNEPRFREEPFFLRFLNNSTAQFDVKIDSFQYNTKNYLNLLGSLSVDSTAVKISLQNAQAPQEGQNYLNFDGQFNYMTNYPYLAFETDLYLTESSLFLKRFLPIEAITDFKHAKFNYKVQASSSTFDHILNSWNADFEMMLTKPKINYSVLLKKDWPAGNIEKVSFSGRNFSNTGWVYNWQEFRKSQNNQEESLFAYGGGQFNDDWENDRRVRSYSISLTPVGR